VRGKSNAIIMDLQRQCFFYIPISLFKLIKKFKSHKIADIRGVLSNAEADVVEEYIEYLIENDLGFYTDDPKRFPAISQKLEEPYDIYDSIIELSEYNLA